MTTAVDETETLTIKKCNRCLLEKPVSEFSRDSSKRNGLRGQCRQCRTELDRIRKGRTSPPPSAAKPEPNTSKIATSKVATSKLNPGVAPVTQAEKQRQSSKAEAHRQAILRLIDRHRSEFDSLVYSEQIRLGVISVNDSPRERWVSLI